jgi:uncharacterized RDD family membrane protein YckC
MRSLSESTEAPIDPFGSDALARVVDVLLIGVGAALVSAPAVYAFVAASLSGAFETERTAAVPWLLLLACMGAFTATSAYGVLRWGTPSAIIRRRAGMPGSAPLVEAAEAPFRLRAGALLLDACVVSAVAFVLGPSLVAFTFFVPTITPFVLFPTVAATTAFIVLYSGLRSPQARSRTLGLTVLGLRRVVTPDGVRTVRIRDLDPPLGARPGATRLAAASLVLVPFICLALYALVGIVGTLLTQLPG